MNVHIVLAQSIFSEFIDANKSVGPFVGNIRKMRTIGARQCHPHSISTLVHHVTHIYCVGVLSSLLETVSLSAHSYE